MGHCSYATEQEQECLTGIILHLFGHNAVCVWHCIEVLHLLLLEMLRGVLNIPAAHGSLC